MMKSYIADLKSTNQRRANLAVKSLLASRSPSLINALLPLAIDPDIEVQSRAVRILSRRLGTEGPRIWSYLKRVFSRENREKRVAVLMALEDLPVAQAAPTLIHFLAHTRDAELQARALGALSVVCHLKGVDRSTPARLFVAAAKSRDRTLRFAGLEGLYGLGDQAFDPLLKKARTDPSFDIRLRYPTYREAVRGRERSRAPRR